MALLTIQLKIYYLKHSIAQNFQIYYFLEVYSKSMFNSSRL